MRRCIVALLLAAVLCLGMRLPATAKEEEQPVTIPLYAYEAYWEVFYAFIQQWMDLDFMPVQIDDIDGDGMPELWFEIPGSETTAIHLWTMKDGKCLAFADSLPTAEFSATVFRNRRIGGTGFSIAVSEGENATYLIDWEALEFMDPPLPDSWKELQAQGWEMLIQPKSGSFSLTGIEHLPEQALKHSFAYFLRAASSLNYIVEGFEYEPFSVGEITPVTMKIEPKTPAPPSAGEENPAWMALYWNVLCQYVEQQGYATDNEYWGASKKLGLLDLNRDGTPEFLLPVDNRIQVHTVRDGQLRTFQGGFPFMEYTEWGSAPVTSLHRNWQNGDERFFADEHYGGCMGSTASLTEYHVDWDTLTITKGTETLRYAEEGWEEVIREMRYYGEEVTQLAQYRRLETSFRNTWRPVPDMELKTDSEVHGRNRSELRRSFYECLQEQGYDVPAMPPRALPDIKKIGADILYTQALQDWRAFRQLAAEQGYGTGEKDVTMQIAYLGEEYSLKKLLVAVCSNQQRKVLGCHVTYQNDRICSFWVPLPQQRELKQLDWVDVPAADGDELMIQFFLAADDAGIRTPHVLDSENIALTPLPEGLFGYSEVIAEAYHGDAPAKPAAYLFWYIGGGAALLLAGGALLAILLRKKCARRIR